MYNSIHIHSASFNEKRASWNSTWLLIHIFYMNFQRPYGMNTECQMWSIRSHIPIDYMNRIQVYNCSWNQRKMRNGNWWKKLCFPCTVLNSIRVDDWTADFSVISSNVRKRTVSHENDSYQWRIYIVKFWTPPTPGAQILSISCSFWEIWTWMIQLESIENDYIRILKSQYYKQMSS